MSVSLISMSLTVRRGQGFANTDSAIDLQENVQGLNWDVIAEKVILLPILECGD